MQQRLLSSIEAFARSLAVHRATVERQWETGRSGRPSAEAAPTPSCFTSAPDADDERATWTAEEARGRGGRADRGASPPPPRPSATRRRREALWRARAATARPDAGRSPRTHRHLPDAKTRRLIDWIRENLCPELPPFGKAARGRRPSGTTAASSSSPRTARARSATSRQILEQAIEGTDRADERIEVIDGLTSGARAQGDPAPVQHRSRQGPAAHPARHRRRPRGPELPGALRRPLPLRPALEPGPHRAAQRPHRPQAPARRRGPLPLLRLPQRAEDRVLEVLVRKTETIKRELGSLSKVIDDDIERRLGQRHPPPRRRAAGAGDRGGRPRRGAEARHRRRSSRHARERQDELEGADRALPRPARSVPSAGRGFERGAVPRRALLLARAARRRAARRDRRRARPAGLDVSRRSTAAPATDPSWAATLDTLRAPRQQNQKLADWRREAPIRPVVFEDAGVLTEDTVHLHLEQRVAQRLLARFRSQGFIHHDLSRACLAQVGRLDPARHPARPPLALRPGGRAAARGARAGRGPLGRADRSATGRSRPTRARPRRRRSSCSSDVARATPARRGPGADDPDEAPRRRRRATSRSCCRSSSRAPRSRPRARDRASSGSAASEEATDLRETLERQRERVREELARHEERVRAAHARLRRGREAPARGRTCGPGARASSSSTATSRREPQRIREFYEVQRDARRAGRARLPLAGDELSAWPSSTPKSSRTSSGSASSGRPGLVVSAPALGARRGDPRPARRRGAAAPARVRRGARRSTPSEGPVPHLPDFRAFAEPVLGWSFSPKGYAGTDRVARSRPSSRCRCPTTARRCAPTSPSASGSRRTARPRGSSSCGSSSPARTSTA